MTPLALFRSRPFRSLISRLGKAFQRTELRADSRARSPLAPLSAPPLVVRFGAFGDMLLIIPMLKSLAARDGQPCDVVASGGWTKPLLSRVPAAGACFLLTSRRAPYWFNQSQRQLVAWLRTRPPGPVYVFESDPKSHALLARGGVRPEWICSLRDYPRLPGEHIMDHALRLAREAPVALRATPSAPPSPPPTARPTLTADDRTDVESWLAHRGLIGVPLLLIQPGNKKTMRRGSRRRASNIKYWPETHWARVIVAAREILPNAGIVICGSPAEQALADDIRQMTHLDGIVVATDDLPIPRLLALQERAHSMISVDTGPAHTAAAMGCPLVVLFSGIDPQLYAPVPNGAPVRLVRADPARSSDGMAGISPEKVIAAWRTLSAT